MELILKSSNATEERVLKYLTENASDCLAEKINDGSKTLAGAVEYAKNLGRKAIGIEAVESYCERAARSMSQEVLSTQTA